MPPRIPPRSQTDDEDEDEEEYWDEVDRYDEEDEDYLKEFVEMEIRDDGEGRRPVRVVDDKIVHAESYVVVSRTRGIVKVAKKQPSLQADEICFKLEVSVPEENWVNRDPVVKVKIPKKDIQKESDITTTLDQIEI